MKRLPILLIAILFFCLPFLLGVSPFVRTDGEPQVQGPLSVYNGLNVKTGVCTLSDDLIVDGGDLGLSVDPNLLQLADEAFTVNGETTLNDDTFCEGDVTIDNAGGDANSYKLYLLAHMTAGDETQTSSIRTAWGLDPYMIIATPSAVGAETDVVHLDTNSLRCAADSGLDIGATGANRFHDVFISGTLDAEVEAIVAQTNITADTGNITATAGAISAGTTVAATTTVTGGTGVIATTGNVTASAGAVSANTTVTAGTNLVATAGSVSAATTVTAGTDLVATAGDVTSGDDVIAGDDLIGRFAAYSVIPIEWCLDGEDYAPAAAEEITAYPGAVMVRAFAGITQTENVICPWHVPENIVAGSGIKFMVTAILHSAAITAEGVNFKMAGDSLGTNDPLACTFGAEVETEVTALTAALKDIVITPYSGVVTVDDLAANELAILHFERDIDDAADDYEEDIGVIFITIKYEALTAGF